jgi:hypothetical protein
VKKMLALEIGVDASEMDLLTQQQAFVTQKTAHDKMRGLITRLSPVVAEGQQLIRLGPKGDGGYLVPDDLTGIAACFSPGVALVSGFEKDCAELGMKVFMADQSMEGPAESHALFHFTKKYVGATTNDHFMTMDDWVGSSLPDDDSDLLLQMDIEGAEYETILRMSDALVQRCRIIVAEFHDLDQLWSSPFFRLAASVFDKILQTHSCVHIHPNNCCGSLQNDGLDIPRVMEFTFLRCDRLQSAVPAKTFPHPLDCDNTDNPPLTLPKCWYDTD